MGNVTITVMYVTIGGDMIAGHMTYTLIHTTMEPFTIDDHVTPASCAGGITKWFHCKQEQMNKHTHSVKIC